jgi:hypothetical protein
MVQCGRLNLHVSEQKYELPEDLPDYRRKFRDFLLRQASPFLAGDLATRFAQTEPNSSERRALFAPLIPVDRLYRCDQGDPVVNHVQTVLGATLYFRCAQLAPQQLLEFVLAYDDGSRVPFDEWSEGQKFAFYVATLLQLAMPAIVLIDEIENHLHPAYMTQLLGSLRQRPMQALLVTHHPHVIFSELVDRVFYVERTAAAMRDPPAELAYDKHRDRHPPIRRIVSLEDKFSRITYTYRLFDRHDNRLLQLASQLQNESELELCRAVDEAFAYPPVGPTSGPAPDTQTQQLARRIADLSSPSTASQFSILDLGAGIGRIARELEKLPRRTDGVRWMLWEPNLQYREALRTIVATAKAPSVVLGNIAEVPDASVNLTLIANVLHELTPEEAADLLRTAVQKMHPHDGGLVVLELYPLLAAERYAVPYPEGVLFDILVDAGLSADTVRFAIRGGLANAYCVLARPIDSLALPGKEVFLKLIKKAWKKMEKDALIQYSNRRNVQSFEDYRQVLQQMTTIASVGAWRAGVWRQQK